MKAVTAPDLDVSRETFERLEVFAGLLRKWTPKINLVAKSTVPDLWNRHIADSLQLFHLAPGNMGNWADLGSGGGLPGLVVAIAAHEAAPDMRVTLVESDKRKAVFLRTVIRETAISAQVLDRRIEDLPPLEADIISARALAGLPKLLTLAHPHLSEGGTCLFPKGAGWAAELEAAKQEWVFHCTRHRSKTDPEAVILKLEGLTHV